MSRRGKILSVCLSTRKGVAKDAVGQAIVKEDYGLDGDAHAGPWHRQVSLLDDVDIETMRAKGMDLKPGAFGENLVVGGVRLNDFGLGTCLRVGSAELEVTQIGKVCHDRCAIYYAAGDCIMPRCGLFARVTRGGEVATGDAVEVLKHVSRDVIQAAVVTVSDRCATGAATDTAGPAAAALLERELDAHVCVRQTVADERGALVETLQDLSGRGIDLIVTVGGTGFGPRDITPEATRAVIERDAPGLAEAMRAASAQLTPHAVLQRGVCGIRGSTLIINLPGSEKGAVENLGAIVAALPHAVRLLRGDTDHDG